MIARRFQSVVLWLAALAAVGVRPAVAADEVLPGTQKLELNEPLDVAMVRGINEFAEQEISLSRDRREAHWHRDYSSVEAYEKSVAPNRERLRTYIGAVDERVQDGTVFANAGAIIARAFGDKRQQFETRITAFDGVNVDSIGTNGVGDVLFIPDVDHVPEVSLGVLPGLPAEQRVAQQLSEGLGIATLMPVLINRNDEYSGNPSVRFTNQPHREFVYRGAFEMGHHIIGYEVQKIMAMVDVMKADVGSSGRPIIVWGHGEGGLLAMMAAAIDPRIDVCIVSGYFQEREGVWREPIYRNVWRQLAEFGDADVASLIAPRKLIIEACSAPEVDGPPAARPGRAGGAAPGVIRTPAIDSVEREFVRAKTHYEKLGCADQLTLIKSGDGTGHVGAEATMGLVRKLMKTEKGDNKLVEPQENEALRQRIAARQKQQVGELTRHTQRLMHLSDKARDKVWAGADRSSLAKWEETQEKYRTLVYDELIGRIPYDLLPPNARTRKIIDEPTHTGYEVVLDVWNSGGGNPKSEIRNSKLEQKSPNSGFEFRASNFEFTSTIDPQPFSTVFAGGVLLLPKDLKPGEKRPVVVCQHGLEGVPMDTITEDTKVEGFQYYKGFSSVLVKRGFIVYAPQNPYRGHDDFRVLQRKSNPLGRSLYSYIIPQHQQTLNWLASLPYVDADRIAFYGLSYGGKTAVRVPPMLPPRESPPVAQLMKEKGWKRLQPGGYWVTSKSSMRNCDLVFEQEKRADVSLTWQYTGGHETIHIGRKDDEVKPEELTSKIAAMSNHDFVEIMADKNTSYVSDPNAVGSSKWFEDQLFKAGCKRVLYTRGLAFGIIVQSDTIAGEQLSPGYCLSICSADFNEWVMKNASYEDRYSYIFTPEYEIFEWNMGHVANYAELSTLMTPRPFMVERGHDDGVAPDEWVAWEYAKVKRHYDKLGIGDRTELEVFNGPHTINGVGTYKFLHKHLNWPEPAR